MIARPFILATLAMVLAGCSAGTAPSASAPPTPMPTPWPTVTAAAYDAAVTACRQAGSYTWPNLSYRDHPAKVPGYDTVSLVPLNIVTLDGKDAPVPESIKALWLNGRPDEYFEPGFGAIARPIGGNADVLVCANFYVTDTASYTGTANNYGAADQLMWALDVTTGKMLGDPWVIRSGGMPEELSQLDLLNGTDIRQGYLLLGADRHAAARSAVLLLKGALPTPTPSPTTDGSG